MWRTRLDRLPVCFALHGVARPVTNGYIRFILKVTDVPIR